MRKALLFLAFGLLSTYVSAQATSPVQITQNSITSHSDLPEYIKGEIPANLDSDMLVELLEMGAVVAKTGELHPLIITNPVILSREISDDSILEAAFREYITTPDQQRRNVLEAQLISVY